MTRQYQNIAVVGGGASGIFAALTAAEIPGQHVFLLERQQRIGRKLLATGNGRCNLTNLNAVPEAYFGADRRFCIPALKHFTAQDTLCSFHALGLLTVTEPGGRVYPLSDSANSVLDVLRFALDAASVEQRCSTAVESILPGKHGFLLRAGGEELRADAVILACGGAAGAKLGGVMDGYRLAKALGHRRTALYPSLTRILTDSDYPRALKGIRVEASMRLTRNDACISEASGEIQFTDNGVSGPAGFDLSRAVSVSGDGQLLHLCLLPMEEHSLLQLLRERKMRFPTLEASELFTGMLHNRLGRVVMKASGIGQNTVLSALSDNALEQAARQCLDFCLPVRGVEGFDTAQVTAGGLQTSDFSPDTLESRLVPGLFVCGELLDVDGPCGGYNLQWAWASGALAGRLGR